MSEYPETPIDQWPVASPLPAPTNGATPHLSDETLAAWAADELAGDERETAQRHLARCAVCQNALAQTQRIQGMMRALDSDVADMAQPGASVVERVLARLPQRVEVDPSRPPGSSGASASPPTVARSSSSRYDNAARETSPATGSSRRGDMRHDTWRRVGAIAAVVLLIASSALLFARLSGRSLSGTPAPTAGPAGLENIPGNWKDVAPGRCWVTDIAVVSPTDIWVVGSNNTGLAPRALLIHFDGKYWHLSPDEFDAVTLESISMVSASEGWAAGFDTNQRPVMLRYSGGHWRNATTLLDLAPLKTQRIPLTNVRMASATAGWALGGDPALAKTTQIFQYLNVGGTYRWEPTESLADTMLYSLSVVSDHEVWVVGTWQSDTPKTVIARITDTVLAGPSGPIVNGWSTHSWDVGAGVLHSVSMRSSTDGWIAGEDGDGAGILYHWDGQHWQRKAFVPDGNEAGPIDGAIMTGANSGWVYAYNGEQNYLYSTAENRWFTYSLPMHRKIFAAAAVSPTTILVFTMTTGSPVFDAAPTLYSMKSGALLPTATPLTP